MAIVEKQIPFRDVVFTRILDELVLVGILERTNTTKEDVLKELENCINAEKQFIQKHGIEESAKIYTYWWEDLNTAREVVKHILEIDYVKHYRDLIPLRPKGTEYP